MIPFRDGQSITDSQLKPRMYKTMQAFEKSFPGYHLGTAGVELVEYAEVVRCKVCTNYYRGYCYHWDYEEGMSPNSVDEDDFCSYGERRTDNE